jgi:hypothetical protein
MREGTLAAHLQVAFDLVVGEPVHFHELPDLLGRGHLRAPQLVQSVHKAPVQLGAPAPPLLTGHGAGAARNRMWGQ